MSEGKWLGADLAEDALSMASLFFQAGDLKETKKHVERARRYLAGGPPFAPHREYIKNAWEGAVRHYNSQAELYRSQGLDVELVNINRRSQKMKKPEDQVDFGNRKLSVDELIIEGQLLQQITSLPPEHKGCELRLIDAHNRDRYLVTEYEWGRGGEAGLERVPYDLTTYAYIRKGNTLQRKE
ncbi:hypothetical protein KY349_01445 [Candidatus Woesearchaeota archaeon]|nr:hypothetical protein [Candidatus Woesearchaeota archaeon]